MIYIIIAWEIQRHDQAGVQAHCGDRPATEPATTALFTCGKNARIMKSTKVQNPRCVYKPIMRVYWPRIAVQLYFPGQYLLLRRLAAACIGLDQAEPAIRPSRTILHDALNGQNCYIAVAYVVMHSPYNDRRGVGSRNYTHAHYL